MGPRGVTPAPSGYTPDTPRARCLAPLTPVPVRVSVRPCARHQSRPATCGFRKAPSFPTPAVSGAIANLIDVPLQLLNLENTSRAVRFAPRTPTSPPPPSAAANTFPHGVRVRRRPPRPLLPDPAGGGGPCGCYDPRRSSSPACVSRRHDVLFPDHSTTLTLRTFDTKF